MTKRNTSDYPIELITNYRAGKISRQQFRQQFSDWQKSRGINYDCKGTADRNGTYLSYRGIKTEIKDGRVFFTHGVFNAPDGTRVFCRDTAFSVFEFCRKVDFCKNIGVIAYAEQRGGNWKNNTAKTVFEFQPKVDFSKNDYPIITVDQQKMLFKTMRG